MTVWNVPADWYGAKRVIKSAASLRPINQVIRSVARQFRVTPTLARLPVATVEVAGRVRDINFVMTNPTRCTIAKELYWGHGERVHRAEQCALELFVDLSRSAELVLDIGANTGVFSLCAALAAPNTRVEAFEIVPEVFEVLVRNVVRNDVANIVSCKLEGVGKDGFTMRVPSFTRSSSLPTSASMLEESASGTTFRFSSLATTLRHARDGSKPLLKVDIEGAEEILFEHAGDALDRFSPDFVCEVLASGDPRGIIRDTLKSAGYHTYRIEEDGLRPTTLDPVAKYHDWLFSRSSPADLRLRTELRVLSARA